MTARSSTLVFHLTRGALILLAMGQPYGTHAPGVNVQRVTPEATDSQPSSLAALHAYFASLPRADSTADEHGKEPRAQYWAALLERYSYREKGTDSGPEFHTLVIAKQAVTNASNAAAIAALQTAQARQVAKEREDESRVAERKRQDAAQAAERAVAAANRELRTGSSAGAKARVVTEKVSRDLQDAIASVKSAEAEAATKRTLSAVAATALMVAETGERTAIAESADAQRHLMRLMHELPDIRPALAYPLLLHGQVVTVENDSRADAYLGIATCAGGKPLITLAERPDYSASPQAMAFLRLHEYGHLLLGHIACAAGAKDHLGKQEELDADCAAIAILKEGRPPLSGDGIIDMMWTHFWDWNEGSYEGHPPSRVRAQKFESCPDVLPPAIKLRMQT